MKYLKLLILIIILTSCENSINNKIDVFYPSGELMITADKIDNKLDGVLCYYYKNGEIISAQSWTNGHFVNELKHYDNNLIEFHIKYMMIQLDSILHENKNYELEVINFPEHILMMSSNNGKIMGQNKKWIVTPETSQKNLELRLYTRFDGEVKEILLIERSVEK